MAKYKPDMWRRDTPEPLFYADTPDSLHGDGFEAGREAMRAHINRAVAVIKRWLADHSAPLETMLAETRQSWLAAGGDNRTWETIFKVAMSESGYSKAMSKEANASIKPSPALAPLKRQNFNGLNLSGLQI